jgi:crotonobetainyl-CoA:carnitine CoA-transferase CaiB-like acyl-CoA transferase
MTKPLSGLLAVSLEQAVAAPYCSAKLADAGARVIKLERPEGDFARRYDKQVKGLSAYFVWLNRGKESLALDIKAPDDAALLHRILAKADVFIQNLAPGAAARAGFGAETLRAKHPRLITCDISGYGEEGPYRDMKAYDLLVQAESGLAAVTGGPEAPGRVGVSVCDIAAGLVAYSAILEALHERTRTGRGGAIAVSLFDVMADWMSVPLLQYLYGGAAPQRVGMNHPSIAPYGAYPTRGEPIVISIQNEREWQAFCAGVLERPALADHVLYADIPRRVQNRAALDREIAAIFTALERDELIARLKRHGIAFGSLNSVASASRHPQLRRARVSTPAGPVDLIAPPVRWLGRAPAEPLGPVPGVGEHNERIKRGLVLKQRE